jgi:hypothetical protein
MDARINLARSRSYLFGHNRAQRSSDGSTFGCEPVRHLIDKIRTQGMTAAECESKVNHHLIIPKLRPYIFRYQRHSLASTLETGRQWQRTDAMFIKSWGCEYKCGPAIGESWASFSETNKSIVAGLFGNYYINRKPFFHDLPPFSTFPLSPTRTYMHHGLAFATSMYKLQGNVS